MVEWSNVRITVLKKLGVQEFWGDKFPTSSTEDLCPRFEVGDVFVTEGLSMPKD